MESHAKDPFGGRLKKHLWQPGAGAFRLNLNAFIFMVSGGCSPVKTSFTDATIWTLQTPTGDCDAPGQGQNRLLCPLWGLFLGLHPDGAPAIPAF
jgi:hypothetical protein